jgi:hypothetical protein
LEFGLEKERPMKAVILAVGLFLPFSFSVASVQLTKMTRGCTAIAAGQRIGWQFGKIGCQEFLSEK